MKRKPKTVSSWHFVSSSLGGSIGRFHHDTRGAISVLVLLIIWCLVAIVGLVWNTTEEAYRREQVQTAADTAAHSAATWMARSINAISAQNMVICQDASAETIWRAVPPTDAAIRQRLEGEIALAQQMKQSGGLQQLRRTLLTQLATIAQEYQLTRDALAVLQAGAGANYANPQDQMDHQNALRQARSVMDWVYNTYVNGQPPPPNGGAPTRPGPPGPNGEGLAQLITAWQPQPEDTILDYIISFINTSELPILMQFEGRTQLATAQPVDAQMQSHEAAVFTTEVAMAQTVPETIEATRMQLAEFYKTGITLAAPANTLGSTGPARIAAPLLRAGDVEPVTGYVDLIRLAYMQEALDANLPLVFDIDPINPQTGDAQIWHPPVQAMVDPALRAQYPGLAGAYTINCTVPDGWGHEWAAPIERYFHDRVSADAATLNEDYMVPLDRARTVMLAAAIRQMLGLPATVNLQIRPLPSRLPDDQPEPPPYTPPNQPPAAPGPPVYDQIAVLPRLTAPAGATAAYRTELNLYNQHGAAFTAAVRGLAGSLQNYIGFYNRFTEGFAQDTWSAQVDAARRTVVQNLGAVKGFMVLATYQLRPIPDWARPGMFDSAAISIEDQIVQMNIQPVSRAMVNDLIGADPSNLGGSFLDAATRQSVLYAAYIGQATRVADAVIRPTAHNVSLVLANEWIRRPWPYEITPPASPVPPYRGVLPDDRIGHFSVLAAARQAPETGSRLILPTYFAAAASPIAAYAQAEANNWHEFDPNYGAAERYDTVVTTPWSGGSYGLFVGSPRAWRVSTVAGWNWRSRLSLSDGLYQSLQNNEEFRQYLQAAGIGNPDSGALNEINLH